jgi:hypothetical protein
LQAVYNSSIYPFPSIHIQVIKQLTIVSSYTQLFSVLFSFYLSSVIGQNGNMAPSSWPKLGSLAIILLLSSLTSAAPAATKVRRSEPTHYMAFGDSFAAGVGAGSELGVLYSDACHRYDKSYPYQLFAQLYGGVMDINNQKACTGATAEQIAQQADDLDSTVDLVSKSEVGFLTDIS